METGVPDLLAAAVHPARTRLTSTNYTSGTEGEPPQRGRSRCQPGHTGRHHTPSRKSQTDTSPETGHQHNQ